MSRWLRTVIIDQSTITQWDDRDRRMMASVDRIVVEVSTKTLEIYFTASALSCVAFARMVKDAMVNDDVYL